MYEPKWDIDLRYGEDGEAYVRQLLKSIVDGDGRVEVKRKRRYLDARFYVETGCDAFHHGIYEPSGIALSKADVYAYVLGDTGIAVFIPTALLRAAMQHPSSRSKAENDGDCPTLGVLVDFGAVLAIARGASQ